tara:strand:+ start:25 stop:2130 length:2106 start_codon:yes stop_codon:yes gene_type:complete
MATSESPRAGPHVDRLTDQLWFAPSTRGLRGERESKRMLARSNWRALAHQRRLAEDERILVYRKGTEQHREFSSPADAASKLEVDANLIRECCINQNKHQDFTFMYVNHCVYVPLQLRVMIQGSNDDSNNNINDKHRIRTRSVSRHMTTTKLKTSDLNTSEHMYTSKKQRLTLAKSSITNSQPKKPLVTVDVPREIIQMILEHTVSSKHPCDNPDDTSNTVFQPDMFWGVSELRRTCKALYFAVLDKYDDLFRIFLAKVHERLQGTNNVSFYDLIRHVDPISCKMTNDPCLEYEHILSDMYVAMVMQKCWTILRTFSISYLIIMACNERNIRGMKNDYKDTVPTLTGFATFIKNGSTEDAMFGAKELVQYLKDSFQKQHPPYSNMIRRFLKYSEWNVISLFGKPGLDAYLEETRKCAEQYGMKNFTHHSMKMHDQISPDCQLDPAHVFLPDDYWPDPKKKTICKKFGAPYVWEHVFSIGEEKYTAVRDMLIPVRLLNNTTHCITLNFPEKFIYEMILNDDHEMVEVWDPSLLPKEYGTLDNFNYNRTACIFMQKEYLTTRNHLFYGNGSKLKCHKILFSFLCMMTSTHLYTKHYAEDKAWRQKKCPISQEWGSTSYFNAIGNKMFYIDKTRMIRGFCDGSVLDLRRYHSIDDTGKKQRKDMWQHIREKRCDSNDLSALCENYLSNSKQIPRELFPFAMQMS